MAVRKLFNDGWFFRKEAGGKPAYDWKSVDVPHDWLIYDSMNLYENSTGQYKKEFNYKKICGERAFIRFDGAYMDTVVHVNGIKAAEWKYGYSTFEFEVTEMLNDGINLIEVSCDYRSPNSRWYSGAGIYRNVWFVTRKEVCIAADGIYISSESGPDGAWTTYIDTELDFSKLGLHSSDAEINSANSTELNTYSLKYLISDAGGNIIHRSARVIDVSETFNRGLENDDLTGSDCFLCISHKITVDSPVLWDVENPYQYSVTVCLCKNDVSIDTEKINYGYRTAVFSPDEGFILNGRKLKLKGVCNHHDLGALGAAVNKCAIKRQICILKEMGVNAIRTAHNMAAPELIEAACEMGILICNESFDMWECKKTEYDYARFFKEWHEKDVRSWVRRDRNAPCVIMWSIGNEIYDTHKDEHGQEITRKLMSLVHKYDYMHNAPVTIGSNYMPWENAAKCADIVKIAGYNYAESYYDVHHREHPDWIIYGSETASVVQSRGVYHFPENVPILYDDDLQCSSLGNSTTSWGAKSIEACITDDRDAPYSAGMFIWSGFDYIGEPTPYHTKNSYFGQVDTAGFPKDSYYVYQSEWTDYRKSPMIHIFPYWDFNDGQIIDVCVCSNAPSVELFVNGESYGRHEIDHEHGKKLIARWKVPYMKGSLRAIAYDDDGGVIAEDETTSFGDAVRLTAHADRNVMRADGRELVFVEIGTVDIDGNPVHNANNRIFVDVTGAGRLVGLDNGDSTDYDSYKGLSKCLFSGKLLAIVASTFEPGEIQVRVTSKGLESLELTIVSEHADRFESEGLPSGGGDSSVFGKCADGLEYERLPSGGGDSSVFGECADGLEYERLLSGGGDSSVFGKCSDGLVYEGLSANERNLAEYTGTWIEDMDEIPVRKLEIKSPFNILTAENPECEAHVEIHPANATYSDLSWRLTADNGVTTNLARLEAGGSSVRIKACGDGNFRLRCEAANNRGHAKVISELEYKVRGVGKASFDAYEMISGSMFSYSEGEISNGNERGASTPRDHESILYYDNIDFGDFGSDIIHIPIFELENDKLEFEIWEGKPYGDGAKKLADAVYDKPSIWNTYQEETFRLTKRLKGLTGIGFVFRRKAHIKGFYFERINKAYEKLYAVDCTGIYGDSYEVYGDTVTGIGNNVTFTYDSMDFGDSGAGTMQICGRTVLDNNTIHVRFKKGDATFNRIVEFSGCSEYTVREFDINGVFGECEVMLIFLPGSNFDLKWLQFYGKNE